LGISGYRAGGYILWLKDKLSPNNTQWLSMAPKIRETQLREAQGCTGMLREEEMNIHPLHHQQCLIVVV
jgi:hypothetical protein